MSHVHLLSLQDIEALRSVIGQPVFLLYSRGVDVYTNTTWANGFSISTPDSFCVVESDWSDTPEHAIDYHVIEASVRDWPKGVGRVKHGDRPDALPGSIISTIHLRRPADDVAMIQVLEQREAHESESVHYDSALIFTRADGYRFSLAPPASIVGGLEFSDHGPIIDGLLAKHSERLRLE